MVVGVFFGGKSCEHNISVITGVQAVKNVSDLHTAVPVYIAQDGVFYSGIGLENMSAYSRLTSGSKLPFEKGAVKKVFRVHLRAGDNGLYNDKGIRVASLDAALVCCHGLNGEDGSLQGLLQLCGVPFTGSGVRASANGMDKITMKKLFSESKLEVVPYVYFEGGSVSDFLAAAEKKLGYPAIVKPSNLGSSIGIAVANNADELGGAVQAALMFDSRIIIEKALVDFVELNCAVLGDSLAAEASEIEKPVGFKEFLTYEDKYVKKMKGGGREFPAQLDKKTAKKVKDDAKKAFHAIGASGVARVDFMLSGEKLYVNEINTIPGALSNYLFENLKYPELIEKLLELAFKEQAARDGLTYNYKSAYVLKSKG